MKKFLFLPLLLAIPLVLASCGTSSGAARTDLTSAVTPASSAPAVQATLPPAPPGIVARDRASDATPFNLKTTDGKTVNLTDYRGKVVFLNFWATWCPPCRSEMPDIQKLWQAYKDKDFVVLAVDLGEASGTVSSFIQKNKFTFQVLLDSSQKVGSDYDIASIPTTFIIDKSGKLRAQRVGAMDYNAMKLYADYFLAE